MTVDPLIGTNIVTTLGNVEVSPGSQIAVEARVLGSGAAMFGNNEVARERRGALKRLRCSEAKL